MMIVHSMQGCRQESGDCQSPFCQPSRQNDGFLAQYKWIRLREESAGNHLPIPGNLGFPHVSTINVPCNQFLARRRALLWAGPLKFSSELTLLFAASDFQLQPSLSSLRCGPMWAPNLDGLSSQLFHLVVSIVMGVPKIDW